MDILQDVLELNLQHQIELFHTKLFELPTSKFLSGESNLITILSVGFGHATPYENEHLPHHFFVQ
jgi:hypothetical protein